MPTQDWFSESREQSIIKAELVSKYFWAWAKVIMSKNPEKIGYIDLFAGPGRYEDGTKSTPLLVLEQAIADPPMRNRLVAMFNDMDENNTQSLEHAITDLPGIGTLRYKPTVHNSEIGTEIVEMFEESRLIPTLFFVDPWGYKGLSLRLIDSVLKNWGCDCIFFFNYNRIRMGIGNDIVKSHMDALFGVDQTERIRKMLDGLPLEEREAAVVEELTRALKGGTSRYVLPFCFKNDRGTRTSHYIIFVSKNVRGYDIMKDIMAKSSSSKTQGVPSFEYSPATTRQPLLFDLIRPLDELGADLLSTFAGQSMTMLDVYNKHNVGTPFIKRNYKDVLKQLELDGKIQAEPSSDHRKKDSFADGVVVTFPS